MKVKILSLCFMFSVTTMVLYGQSLSTKEFRVRVHKALDSADTTRVENLFLSQRSDAIQFIESLLDSAIVNQAGGKNDPGLNYVRKSKILATIYSGLFGDNYYVEKSLRYSEFNPSALPQKAEIIDLKSQGRQDFYQGNFQTAGEKFNTAYQLAAAIEDVDAKGELLGNVGSAFFYLGEFDTALVYYQRSLDILDKIGDKRRIGNTLGNIGNVYSDKSDYPTALVYFDKALKIRNELDDKRGLAADLNNIGLIYEEMGEYYKALENYRKALEINRAIDNKRSVGKNLANIANVHINLGEYPQAVQTYEQARVIRLALQDRKGEGNDLGNLGIVYQNLGDYNKAMSCFKEALAIHKELGYREGEAYQLGRIAGLYTMAGDYAKAVKTYQEALTIHQEMGHMRGVANWIESLAGTYTAVGDYSRALDNYNSALDLYKNMGNRSGEAITLSTMGITYIQLEEFKKAKDQFTKALSIHQDIGEKWGECVDLGNLFYVFTLEKDSVQAVSVGNDASKLANQLGNKFLQAWLHLLAGDFYRDYEDNNRAEKEYELGLAISEELNVPELRWQFYFGRGRLWKNRGDNERAYYSYRAAINLIEEVRGKSVIEEMKAGLMRDSYEVYEEMIMLLYKMDRHQEAFEYVERARARNLLDLLGNVKIKNHVSKTEEQTEKEQILRAKISKQQSQMNHEDVRGAANKIYRTSLLNSRKEYHRLLSDIKLYNPEYASMVSVDPLSKAQIQQLLDEKSVLLEYFITDNTLLIFVVSNEGLNVLPVSEGETSLRGKIKLFRGTAVQQMTSKKISDNYWIPPMQNLYEILILPVEEAGYLSGKNHIIIVPQGILHYLPFQALVTRWDTNRGEHTAPQFLIETYNISYIPSASILKFCREKKHNQINNLLLLAPQITQLPMSENEVLEITNSFGQNAEYYLGAEASESLVKERGRGYKLLHFATTGRFNKANPLFSSIDLAKSQYDDGNLEVHEILNMELNADLITLSACQTALASGYYEVLPQGDDLESLTRAFLYAGTPSVIASLWEIADPSTAGFMSHFYENLKNMTKVEALAQTQRDMINGKIYGQRNEGNNLYIHPFYWAPFVLVGDWN